MLYCQGWSLRLQQVSKVQGARCHQSAYPPELFPFVGGSSSQRGPATGDSVWGHGWPDPLAVRSRGWCQKQSKTGTVARTRDTARSVTKCSGVILESASLELQSLEARIRSDVAVSIVGCVVQLGAAVKDHGRGASCLLLRTWLLDWHCYVANFILSTRPATAGLHFLIVDSLSRS